ncbi:hypothetical protein ACFCXT_06355 [Streptomyces vinaceus]|uniref:hypothetical protein n=1 Tax=Streptomyces vinaceus TaxID=1960 RepID=UPI0035DAB7CD
MSTTRTSPPRICRPVPLRTPAADLLGVGAAVAVHEVPYGELEVVVVEAVEVLDGVAQALSPDLVPSGSLLAPAQPQRAPGAG